MITINEWFHRQAPCEKLLNLLKKLLNLLKKLLNLLKKLLMVLCVNDSQF